MEIHKCVSGLLVLTFMLPSAEAMNMYDPKLCYILDGFLGLYGLIITGMFIKEKFFRTKQKKGEESIYSDLEGRDSTYTPLRTDLEKGRSRARSEDATYTGLNKYGGEEYRELPVKRERQKKGEQVYQGLRSATRDTYDELHMQPLPGLFPGGSKSSILLLMYSLSPLHMSKPSQSDLDDFISKTSNMCCSISVPPSNCSSSTPPNSAPPCSCSQAVWSSLFDCLELPDTHIPQQEGNDES